MLPVQVSGRRWSHFVNRDRMPSIRAFTGRMLVASTLCHATRAQTRCLLSHHQKSRGPGRFACGSVWLACRGRGPQASLQLRQAPVACVHVRMLTHCSLLPCAPDNIARRRQQPRVWAPCPLQGGSIQHYLASQPAGRWPRHAAAGVLRRRCHHNHNVMPHRDAAPASCAMPNRDAAPLSCVMPHREAPASCPVHKKTQKRGKTRRLAASQSPPPAAARQSRRGG